MTKKMLIDATHPEETRVAIISGNKLEEYDYETLVRQQIKSNIYLVKVTRVEPSLQAAFVDYGGNRHGFLPFPEIHPDYYRIPIADREALLAEERAFAEAQAAKEEAEDVAALAAEGKSIEDLEKELEAELDEEEDFDDLEDLDEDEIAHMASSVEAEDDSDDEDEEGKTQSARKTSETIIDDSDDSDSDETSDEDEEDCDDNSASSEDDNGDDDEDDNDTAEVAEVVTEKQPDIEDETPVFRSSIKRRYKIQEVIKRNQIMLIQINKEERGNKGAAVTSYISLPGRYCVLMPNSPRGGGVSRKVSNVKDRQRLKKILRDLNVPEGMSVILRTAGVSRNKADIRRDLDYLLRLWDEIRQMTLKSTAPTLIYEEGNLIKRSIRDLYKKEIKEVHVSGEEGYKVAKSFMKTLMPSHASRVQQYKDTSMPLFYRYQVEKQIDEIHSPEVHLKSGGYIVFNPTEALVSVDVNSGRATKGRHIEETALKTNLEAAEEIARQLRLRDLGGLVVIDYIDMEDRKNNRAVERKTRDAVQGDRARVQVGRLSSFGLLEMSRQRLRPSLVEQNFEVCKHCKGSGVVRTIETSAVMVLRAIEAESLQNRVSEVKVSLPTEVAIYIFNHKRAMLTTIQERHDVQIFLNPNDDLLKPDFEIESSKASKKVEIKSTPISSVQMLDDDDTSDDDDNGNIHDTDDDDIVEGNDGENRGGDKDDDNNNRRNQNRNNNNRRRGRRGGRNKTRRNDNNNNDDQKENTLSDDNTPSDNTSSDTTSNDSNGDESKKPRGHRRRGRRGGRNSTRPQNSNNNDDGKSERPERVERPERGSLDQKSNDVKNIPIAVRSETKKPNTRQSNRNSDNHDKNDAKGEGSDRKGWWQRLTE